MDDLLFYEGDMHTGLETAIRNARRYCESLSAAQINAASDEEIVQHVVSRHRIEPLTLLQDHAYTKYRESEVDVSRHLNRAVFDRETPCMIKANEITVHIPFTGDPSLFRIRPTTYSLNPPRGAVHKQSNTSGELRIHNTQPMDQPDYDFNKWMRESIDSIEQSVGRSRADICRFNAQLEVEAPAWVAKRREQLRSQGELLSRLEIPLRRDSEAPEPLPMPKRVIKPLPNPQAIEQEYAIPDKDYEFILKVIRHQTRSFEQAPAAFQKLDEEELRDVILANLNSHFEGDAAAERFRRSGKTDICIEHANRAAFVAECKLWGGAKVLSSAIDQLLGYLTWRDCRAALILFNKSVQGFTSLQDTLSNHLAAHPQFVEALPSGCAGEWRVVLSAPGDDRRRITVHVYLVDLLARTRIG